MSYLTRVLNQPTPQSEPLDQRQVENSAGGYSYPVDDWTRLDRFLILGSEGGSYYASERKLTLENAEAVTRCAQQDGQRAVDRVVEIATTGRCPRVEPPIFALAICAAKGDLDTRKLARAQLPRVARTATHLMQFVEFSTIMRGWGRGLRRAVQDWYTSRSPGQIAYQMVKYRQREGWTHRDLLRKCHGFIPQEDRELRDILQWVTHGDLPPESDATRLILAFEKAKEAGTDELAGLIRKHRMSWEMVPPEKMGEAAVWEALAEDMPLVATIRNLGNLTRHGIIAPMKFQTQVEAIRSIGKEGAPPIHPIAVLRALLTYRGGRGQRGQNSWEPVPQIVEALGESFERSFQAAPRTGKRIYLGIDVSGSMDGGMVAGVEGLSPRMAATAMAMAVARRENNYHLAAFAEGMVPLDITPRDRLTEAMGKTKGFPLRRTDCALPMLDALDRKIPVDCFTVLTDSETWFGKIHPMEALRKYRREMGIPAKLAVVGMVSNGFTIADPEDAGTLDVVGFDSAAPRLIAEFVSESENGQAPDMEE